MPETTTARLNFQPRRFLLLAVRLLEVSSVRVSHLDTVDLWAWVIPWLGVGRVPPSQAHLPSHLDSAAGVPRSPCFSVWMLSSNWITLPV